MFSTFTLSLVMWHTLTCIHTVLNPTDCTYNHKQLFVIFVMLYLHILAPVCHLQGGNFQRDTFIINTVKNMHI